MTEPKDRASTPSGFAVIPQLWLSHSFSRMRLERGKAGYCHPAVLSLVLALGGLLWLWAINPLLITWLYPGSTLPSLASSVPSALAILAGAGLLYWVLKACNVAMHRTQCAQHQQLAEFIAYSPDPAFLKDQQGRYLAVNAAFAQLAGRPAIECLNQDDSALFSPETVALFIDHDQRVIADGTASNREITLAIHGDTHVLLTTRWPYRDTEGCSIGVCGIAQEITAQKKAENQVYSANTNMESRIRERTAALQSINEDLERQIAARIQAEVALRDSQERFRQLAEHIREVFWVYGVEEERPLYISPAYEEIWGHPIDGLLERPMTWIEAIHPDDRARVQAAHITKCGSGYFDEEYRIIRPDGTIRWIWDRGFPVCDEAGRIYRIAGLAEDITRRKLAEDQLRRQQVELTRISRLSLAVELAANLAHQLNQPLAAIVAYTQACLTLLRQADTDPRVLTGTLDEIVNQGLRAGEIIRHLRELVQKHPAAQAALDLNALIRSVVRYAQTELNQAGVSLKLSLADPLPAALADDIQIQLVLLSLIRNAIESMGEQADGPHELTVSTAMADPGSVWVTVRDTGPGFRLDMEDDLFRPFFTTKPGGMGLGLSVGRSIIESQGGQLWATLNLDGGAAFHFSLPAYPDA